MTTSISANAIAKPRHGATSDGMSDLVPDPVPVDDVEPVAAIAEPAIPPISAWLELDGSPRNQVIRFQRDRADEARRGRRSSVIASGSTIPFAIVAATCERDERAGEVEDRRDRRPRRAGVSARVETLVAIEFAVSWKPFVKSKKSATATTATSVRSSTPRASGVLDDDVRDRRSPPSRRRRARARAAS